MSEDIDGRQGGEARKADQKANKEANEKMSCENVQANLDAYLDGELEADLSGERAAAFKAHLASCEECLARLERRKALVGLVQALPVPNAPAGLVERILAETGRASRPERPKFLVKLRTWVPALAAAAVVFLAAVIGLRSTREERVPPEYAALETAREAEETAPAPPPAAPVPSPDAVAAKAKAGAAGEDLAPEAVALAGDKDVGEPRVLGKAAGRKAAPVLAEARAPVTKKAAVSSLSEPAPARDAARPVAKAPPRALRFEKKAAPAPRRGGVTSPGAVAKGQERAVAAKAPPPEPPRPRDRSRFGAAKARSKSYRARSARRATGEQYRPQVTQELDRAAEAGRSAVIPQRAAGHDVLRIWQEAAGRGEEVHVLTSGVTAARVAKAGGGAELFIKVPLVTSDPLATQIRLVTMARDLGGEFVKGFSRGGGRLDGPGLALALTDVAEKRLDEQAGRLKHEAAKDIPPSPVKRRGPAGSRTPAGRRGLKVVVRIPGEGWYRFLSRIGLAEIAREGKPAAPSAEAFRQERSGDGIRIPPLSRKALYRGGVTTATVEFPLISPEELAAETETPTGARAGKAAMEAAGAEAEAAEPPADAGATR